MYRSATAIENDAGRQLHDLIGFAERLSQRDLTDPERARRDGVPARRGESACLGTASHRQSGRAFIHVRSGAPNVSSPKKSRATSAVDLLLRKRRAAQHSKHSLINKGLHCAKPCCRCAFIGNRQVQPRVP